MICAAISYQFAAIWHTCIPVPPICTDLPRRRRFHQLVLASRPASPPLARLPAISTCAIKKMKAFISTCAISTCAMKVWYTSARAP